MNPSKRFHLLQIAFLLALPLGGCAKRAANGVQEIVYWTGWSGHELAVQEKLIAEFNRTHPRIHVRLLTQFSSTGTYQKVKIAFAGGATPDVMSCIWDFELAGFALRGVLTPLDEFLLRSGRDVDREYSPGIARMARIDGKIYGLTVTTNANFIVYNKDIFRESGLNPERPPQAINELDRAAKACIRTDSNGNLIRYGFRPLNLDLWAYVFGGQWVDPATGRITANDPRNVAALRWMASYNRMFDLRKIQSFTSSFGENESANGPFFIGKMAMWQTGEWSEEFIRRYAPNMHWGWFPLPYPTTTQRPNDPTTQRPTIPGRPNVTNVRGSVFVIPAACKHKEAAWEFLNWITSPHAVKTFCTAIKNVPPLKAVGQEPVFQNDPLFRFAVGLANGPNAFGSPTIPIWSTYRRDIQRIEDLAVMGGQDPQRLLDDLQRRMEREQQRTMEELQ